MQGNRLIAALLSAAVALSLAGGALVAADEKPDAKPDETPAADAKKPTITLTDEEKQQGWRILFDGTSLDGWHNGQGEPPSSGWAIEDGAMVRAGRAGMIWTKERFGDFVLDLEFKTKGNSGLFFRTDNMRDCVQAGIEMQVERTSNLGSRHSAGAIYDCLAPSKAAAKEGEWNHVVLTCDDNKITIVMNGEQVIDMDLDQWTEANKNPDGSRNKFRTAYKDMKREGHVGFQDHGAWVAFRSIKIKPLNPSPVKAEATCPVCGRKGQEGEFCAKCATIVTARGEYKCTMCGKKVKSGTYCEKHNKFRFSVNDGVACPKCGKTKGTFCPKCGYYACLPNVSFCPDCKKPFDKTAKDGACTKCGKKPDFSRYVPPAAAPPAKAPAKKPPTPKSPDPLSEIEGKLK